LAVAAQLPLALLLRLRQPFGRRLPAMAIGLTGLTALGLQGLAVAQAWPDRETNLYGLGGAAARAARTAEASGAGVIYVASSDGSPRSFGAGSLPGLRFPWFKWFDPAKSLPIPADSTTAVYVLNELPAARGLTDCLGQADEVVLTGRQVRDQCLARQAIHEVGATFDGLARVDGVYIADTLEAGETAEARLVWQPLTRPTTSQQAWLHLEDADSGTLWGNATQELYPAFEWQADETLLSRLPMPTDPMAMPDRYQLTLGMGGVGAAPATATWRGSRTDRVPVGSLALEPARASLAMLALPADMQSVSGVIGDGLELIAARPPSSEVRPGQRVRLGLLWRAQQDAPAAEQFRVRLVRANGDVVQDTALPLLGGRRAPSSLRSGNVVRDEESFDIAAHAPTEMLTVEVGLGQARAAIGSVSVAGRQHTFEPRPPAQFEAVFGSSMALERHRFEPRSTSLTVQLRWRSLAPIERSYKVFAHVLDPTGQKVVAQRDSAPLAGRAPTPSWVPGEVLDDELEIPLPAGLAAGGYPLEVGVYEERSGERLLLPNGEGRVLFVDAVRVN
jgi:hypothetical protein